MLKKILYAVVAIVMGFLFMLAFFMSSIQSKMEELVSKANETGDYSYILTAYDDLSNKNAIYQKRNTDESIFSVYETGNYKTITKLDVEYQILDPTYSIIIGNNQRKESNVSKNDYTQNATGFKITLTTGEVYTYYDNACTDGVVDSTYPTYKTEIYGDYNSIDNAYGGVNLYEYKISYDFMVYLTGGSDFSIKSIALIDASANTYGSVIEFDTPLTFSSETHKLMFKLKEKCLENSNDVISSSDRDSYYSNEWKPAYLAIDGCTILDESSYYYTASFYFKMIMIFIAYVIIMLGIGDTLVGKKRLINFFRNISHKDNTKQVYNKKDKNVVDADVRVINSDVKKDKDEK